MRAADRAQHRHLVFPGQQERPAGRGGAAQAGGLHGGGKVSQALAELQWVLPADCLQGCPLVGGPAGSKPFGEPRPLLYSELGKKLTEEGLQQKAKT